VILIAVNPGEFGQFTHTPPAGVRLRMSNRSKPGVNSLLLQLPAPRGRPKLHGIAGKNAFGLNNITKIFVNQFVQTSLGGGKSEGIMFSISREYIVVYKNVAHTSP
jgi:hypothetical protein